MVQDPLLKAAPREKLGKRNTRRLRAEGLVPGNVYGMGSDPVSVTFTAEEVDTLVAARSRVCDVEVAGAVSKAVVQELQWDVYSTYVQHIDIKKVDPDGITTVDVPVTVYGEAAGLKDGGVLVQHMKTVKITCPDYRVPKFIQARVGAMGLGEVMTASGLSLPETATLVTPADEPAIEIRDPKKSA